MTIDEGHFITDDNLEKTIDDAYYKGYNKAIDEAIEIVKGNYRIESLEKLEQLKEVGESGKLSV